MTVEPLTKAWREFFADLAPAEDTVAVREAFAAGWDSGRAALREVAERFRRVQVWDGEGDLILDVLLVTPVEADWLHDYLEGTDAGVVYIDSVLSLRLPADLRAILTEATGASE